MKRRWIFFDRDGTILVDKHYMHDITDIEFLPGAIEGLIFLQDQGFELIIITNQSGIARKYFTIEQAYKFNHEVEHRLKTKGVIIKKTYICPHHPNFIEPCECRKPRTGMAKKAVEEFQINLRESIFMGDKDSDTEFGKNCGGMTFLIDNGQYVTTLEPDYRVKNLREAADILIGELRS